AETLRQAYRWLRRGCEIGMYPYVIPFSGSAIAQDPQLLPHTTSIRRRVMGTNVQWNQALKILPIDPAVSAAILEIEQAFEEMMRSLEGHAAHVPSRVRSLVWILCSLPVMAERGMYIADEQDLRAELHERLPMLQRVTARTAIAVPCKPSDHGQCSRLLPCAYCSAAGSPCLRRAPRRRTSRSWSTCWPTSSSIPMRSTMRCGCTCAAGIPRPAAKAMKIAICRSISPPRCRRG